MLGGNTCHTPKHDVCSCHACHMATCSQGGAEKLNCVNFSIVASAQSNGPKYQTCYTDTILTCACLVGTLESSPNPMFTAVMLATTSTCSQGGAKKLNCVICSLVASAPSNGPKYQTSSIDTILTCACCVETLATSPNPMSTAVMLATWPLVVKVVHKN